MHQRFTMRSGPQVLLPVRHPRLSEPVHAGSGTELPDVSVAFGSPRIASGERGSLRARPRPISVEANLRAARSGRDTFRAFGEGIPSLFLARASLDPCR